MTAARRQRRREADDDVPKAGTPIQDPVLKNVKPGPDVEPALHDLLKGAARPPRREHGIKRFFQVLGPGLVTGASDDDPSGIGTYSQVGAQFGYALLWTMVFSYPLMAAIQEISARIGRVTGVGIAANLRKNYPKPLLYAVLFVVSVANVFNLGADIGAMGAATQLVLPGNAGLFIAIFGIGSLAAILL